MTRTAQKNTFRTVIKTIQAPMPAPQRLYSKILHAPIVEYPLSILANSLLGPRAIIGASVGTTIALMLSYIIVSSASYHLTGSEGLIGGLIGWLIGLIADIISLVRRKK